MDIPTFPDYCAECDDEIELDEPAGLCAYTGGRCPPGPCDCGTTYRRVCEACAIDTGEQGHPLVHPLEDPNPERILEARHERQEAEFNERNR